MQRDLAAACRLLDVHLAAVHGDVLDIRIRVRVMRRRDGIAVEEIALAAEIVNGELISCRRSRHIEDAASCRARRCEILYMARARELPECAGCKMTHVQLGGGSRFAFPKGAVAHVKVDFARTVPLPRGIRRVEADVDDAVCRAEIAFEHGLVRARARHRPGAVRRDVDVDATLLVSRSGGACQESAIRRLDRAARDADVGRGCVERRRCFRAVRLDVRKSVDLDGGACARRARLDHGCVCRRAGLGTELHRLALARVDRDLAAVLRLHGGAACRERRDVEIARILDGNFLAVGCDACDGRGIACRNDEIMPLHVDEERLRRRIVVRDGGRDAVRRDRCPILRENIAAVRLAHAVARVYGIGGSVRDGGCEVLNGLVVVDGRSRAVYAAMIGIKLDVSEPIRDLCAR